MAIIPCRECSHQVSDQAISCPSCGVPIAPAVKTTPYRMGVVSRVLIILMALWTLGTILWLFVPRGASDQMSLRTRTSLQRLDQSIGHLWNADFTRTTQGGNNTVAHPPARTQPSTATVAVSAQPPVQPPPPPARALYRTTAEQLYRDYEANVVATQTKIGASRVQLTGNVTAIDQDASGRPVVKLWTGKDSTAAALTLDAEQRTAAAQLAKGEAVEIACDKLGHSGPSLQGEGCTLSSLEATPKDVNLALFLANESGTTRVYVVGPMTEAVCNERSAEISSRLQGGRRGEHIVTRNCTDTARERIAPEGCRLNASTLSVTDAPTAHLWRYDCNSSTVARAARHRRTPALESTLAAIPSATLESGATASDAGDDSTAARAIPLPITDSVAVPGMPVTNNIRLASAGSSDTGTATARMPSEESTVAHATQNLSAAAISTPARASPSTVSTGTAAASDDLSRVRATDPQAADHIASYCGQINASVNRDSFIADCRHTEADAWTRLVLQNEFPTMDDATRKRCSEPPFPDTYVAKETCARYLLRAR